MTASGRNQPLGRPGVDWQLLTHSGRTVRRYGCYLPQSGVNG